MGNAKDNDFFVGYLPQSPATRRFVRMSLGALFTLAVVIGVTLAATQRDPGKGQWNTSEGQTFHGVLRETPYATLRSDGREYLLVDEGKHGAAIHVCGLDKLSVLVKGQLLERPPLAVIEVSDVSKISKTATAEASIDASTETKSAVLPSGPVVKLQGEIIDSKCYAGAMKPGDGKTHKACAVLCIRGGIPPMFRAVGPAGTSTLYLLVGPDGGPLAGDLLEQIVPFIADPVECQGTVRPSGQTKVLHVLPESLRRL